jgi:hypothetical protein
MKTKLFERARHEGGFTMGVVMIAALIVTVAATVALGAATGDLNGTRNDLDQKQAYDAAQAGINDYAFHLNNDSNYWTKCDTVPAPNAVNQVGSTAKRRFVPGSTTASYAIELIPAGWSSTSSPGQGSCKTADPLGSMVEPAGTMGGTFRVRSTGYAGKAKRSIVATFKRRSFLDYVYFTQYETSDPVTYGDPDTVADASVACERWRREGRPSPSGGQPYCNVITFPDFDYIKGPLHTNDDLMTCGSPTFGRSPADVIEVSAPPPGWQRLSSGCGSGSPNFQGTYVTNAPVLTPPPTNGEIENVALPGGKFVGNVIIFLTGNSMNVFNGTSWTTSAIPANGVIYVSNDPNKPCSAAYSPFTATYFDTGSGCGNVYVSADTTGYTSQLTIAAENDIIIYGNVLRTSGSPGILGLIANNFVRVYHPYPNETLNSCGSNSGEVKLDNVRIDAAVMAIQHSFIVDHYDCGSTLGTLTVNGAISQKYRGPVGTFSSGGSGSSTGYTKDYNYDDRLRVLTPPFFLDPVEAAWHVQRETLDFP